MAAEQDFSQLRPVRRSAHQAVVERHHLEHRAVGQRPGRQVGAQPAAGVVDRHVGAGHRREIGVGRTRLPSGDSPCPHAADRRLQHDADRHRLLGARPARRVRSPVRRPDPARPARPRTPPARAPHRTPSGSHCVVPGSTRAHRSRGGKLRRPTMRRVARSTTRSTRPNARPPEYASVMAMPVDLVRHRRVRVAGDDDVDQPGGRSRATPEDLGVSVARGQVVGAIELASHRPPAWAATTTIDAPCGAQRRGLGRDRRRQRRHAAGRRSWRRSSPPAPRCVITPTMPTLTPAAVDHVDGLHVRPRHRPAGRVSIRFAARNGNAASAARAFSAPRGSSAGGCGIAAGPDRTEVELVIADRRGACSRARCRRPRPTPLR